MFISTILHECTLYMNQVIKTIFRHGIKLHTVSAILIDSKYTSQDFSFSNKDWKII